MRALLLAIAMLVALTGIVSAASLCPFDVTPQTFPTGTFALTKTVAGSSEGVFIGSEESVYADKLSTNVYRNLLLSSGTTSYASQITSGASFVSTKAVEQNGGTALMDEGYYQGSLSLTNLTYCDQVTGGSRIDTSYGAFATSTTLNAPVSMNYNVAMSGLNNNKAFGSASVYMNGKSMEGTNSTLIATQEINQRNTWIGKFEFAVDDSLRITHPISGNYYTLAKQVNSTIC